MPTQVVVHGKTCQCITTESKVLGYFLHARIGVGKPKLANRKGGSENTSQSLRRVGVIKNHCLSNHHNVGKNQA